MNFWFDSAKSKLSTDGESFYFDVETPRGHLFTVLDFAPHDYANLDATLERKLETIVESFDSVPRFSADLFLGFLAKEINNFLYELEKQSGGAEMFASGALCLLSGNRLAYVIYGDTQLNILGSSRSLSLSETGPEVSESAVAIPGGEQNDELSASQRTSTHLDELGARHWDAPLTGRVPAFTLQYDDVVLITTGREEPLARPEFSAMVQDVDSSDSQSIGEALTSSSEHFGAVLVISGPYDQYVDPLLADLSKAFDSLEEKVNGLTEVHQRAVVVPEFMESTLEAELEQRINPQIEELKDGLRSKANSIDILELNEILKNLSAAVASKADTAEVLELQRDVLKLSLASNANGVNGTNNTNRQSEEVEGVVPFSESGSDDSDLHEEAASGSGRDVPEIPRQNSFSLRTALMVLAIAIAGAFIGAWFQSRILKKNPEVWAVKSSGNQIWINRMDQGGQGNVTLNVATPLRSRGEQTFSSFADVKQYIDTITVPQVSADQTSQATEENRPFENKPADTVSRGVAKPVASLKLPSQSEKTFPKKPSELTAVANKKPDLKSPRKASSSSSTTPAALVQRDRRVSANSAAATTPVTVGAGDTLNKLAHRYQTTPDQLKKLNPQINEQGVIRPSQKILVPAASSPKDSKGRRLMLVKQAH
jgi:LysM repeat protein